MKWKKGRKDGRANIHLFANPFNLTHVLVVLGERIIDLLHGCDLLLARLVGKRVATKSATGFLEALQVLLDPFNVFQTELGGNDVHVAAGVNVTLDVDDLGIVEGADDLEDTVYGADVREEGVSKTSTC